MSRATGISHSAHARIPRATTCGSSAYLGCGWNAHTWHTNAILNTRNTCLRIQSIALRCTEGILWLLITHLHSLNTKKAEKPDEARSRITGSARLIIHSSSEVLFDSSCCLIYEDTDSGWSYTFKSIFFRESVLLSPEISNNVWIDVSWTVCHLYF